ncbi:hypothetical protein MUK71_12215 [Arthrobacter zhangbolii]|uniref:Uncharacterized protein n=1 Tax=Arthrobacter zhangbolii TaxID=2886936 RepID=A0A9X1M9L6_9MICC|nr:hypothetical protein [Arthrobacter zhangbolii]MCC3272809.1 hypothetical protein [Arthrobacter zhangbolii]UON91358.1 hypothetical protein MUK71_12215 [Arthrobacter zhangbolii]
MENTHQNGDARAQLEGFLSHLQNLLRYIDARLQEKGTIAQRYQPLEPLNPKWGILPLVLLTVGLVVLLTAIGTPIIQAWAKADAYAQGQIFYSNIQPLSVAILASPVALALASAIWLVRNRLVLPRLHARTEQINQQRVTHNQAVSADEQRVDAQLTQASRDFASDIGNRFPQAYLYDEAVGFCLQLVRDHRASTIHDAINLYETERYRQRMENLQAWQLAEAQQTRKLMALGTVVNAAMQGAMIGTVRHEGAQTRAALRKPVNVNVRVR